MALYLAIHEPSGDEEAVTPPADLVGLAQALDGARWLTAYTPDLHDDRHVSLWDADSAEAVRRQMERFRFFVEADTVVFRVRSWGPAAVLAAEAGSPGEAAG